MDMVKDLLSNNIVYGQTSYDWMLICVTIFSFYDKKVSECKYTSIKYSNINKVLIYGLKHCYIPVRIRIQVQSLENALIMRDSHKSRTRLILFFKMV